MELLSLTPLLPVADAAVIGAIGAMGALGKRAPKSLVTLVGLGAPLASLLIALVCLGQYMGIHPQPVEQVLYAWTSGEVNIEFAFLLDPISAVMLFVVTII